MATVTTDFSLLGDQDLFLFNEGTHRALAEKLGSHIVRTKSHRGVYFAVWAPNARRVSVIGDFNGWDSTSHPLKVRGSSGIWEGFIPNLGEGARYKYHIVSNNGGYAVDKADPYALHAEEPPNTASVVWNLSGYEWEDSDWMRTRGERHKYTAPISIYEVHLGSWKRPDGSNRRYYNYREYGEALAEYVGNLGFTHIELLPIMEHPFYGSWGYQTTGYFAPSSRYGTPQDFMAMVDTLHQAGIGVLLDWVPSHFPSDGHGLSYFDGTHLYEHADPRQGFHPDWNSLIFNYGRNEVRAFLLSSAIHWLEKYHIDGLRVDAVASMLYLDYSRKQGEWIPNRYGTNENLEAIDFLKRFNADIYESFPDTFTVAEESTAWPNVSRPLYVGGLGFGYKWDMGWMHDTLHYLSFEPIHRKYHHNELTFRGVYAFSENYVLPLSHDEVVHGKGSLLGKMPGDPWQRFANLRLLFGYMFTTPAKKLLFMGGELGQWTEWNHESQLDWALQEFPNHSGLQRWVRDLNTTYRAYPALHELDNDPNGWSWIEAHDGDQSVISYLRRGSKPDELVMVVCNFTPVPRENYRIGVPKAGYWQEILNSDATLYGGSGVGNAGGLATTNWASHGHPQSLGMTLPPLGMLAFRFAKDETSDKPAR